MEKINLTCINCPLGCPVQVTMDGGEIVEITGYTCPRGEQYARKEVTNPTRIVTSSVLVYGSQSGAVTVSCKTKSDVPKGKIFDRGHRRGHDCDENRKITNISCIFIELEEHHEEIYQCSRSG